MTKTKTVAVHLTRSEAGLLASIAEMTLDGSGLAFRDWLDVNADKQKRLEAAERKMTRAYNSFEETE